MADAWKTLLNEYVSRLNRMEVDCGIEPLRGLVTDEDYIERRSAIFRRLYDTAEPRPKPIRSETRAKPDSVKEQDRLAVVRLRLYKRWTYDGDPVQERIENEKLTLAYRRGEWVIAKVDAETPERKAVIPEAQPGGVPQPYLNRHVIANRNHAARAVRYNRIAARDYAEMWWNSSNPKYHRFEVDCTSFVSQCLFAGGIPMNYTGRRDSGWWYEGFVNGRERWSYSWAVANSLQTCLLNSRTGLRGVQAGDPRKLSLGDIISYDWDGDARYTHTTIVTAFDKAGFPLVNAHTNDSRLRYWDYRDSYAWTERTRYTFIHIPDQL